MTGTSDQSETKLPEELIKTVGTYHVEKYESMLDAISDARLLGSFDTLMDVCSGNNFFGYYIAKIFPGIVVLSLDERITNMQKKIGKHFYCENHSFIPFDVKTQTLPLNKGYLVTAIHACGDLSDIVIEQCVSSRVPFAVMPCCYSNRTYFPVSGTFNSIRDAADHSRLEFMKRNEYSRWIKDAEPGTPMRKILIGIPVEIDARKR